MTIGPGPTPFYASSNPALNPAGDEFREWGRIAESPVRRLGFYCALVMLFLRFSTLHESLSLIVGHPLYLLYVVGPPALLATVISGGLGRTLSSRASICWLAFAGIILLDVPMSSWPGGSLYLFYTYMKTELPIMFVIGGLILTWKECRAVFTAIGLGTLVLLFTSHLLLKDDGSGRVSLDAGTIANANDLAAHLVLVTPFLLYVAMSERAFVIRMVAAVGVLWSIYQILGTASRGALIALALMSLILLIRSSTKTRLVSMIVLPCIVAGVFSSLIFGDDNPPFLVLRFRNRQRGSPCFLGTTGVPSPSEPRHDGYPSSFWSGPRPILHAGGSH